jgi:integrase
VLASAEVYVLRAALRTHRDRAMVDAMVLGGRRRCEVSGLRLEDLSAGQRRLFVAEGKGGRQRIVPVSARFFAAVGAYLESERPAESAARHVFVALKGPPPRPAAVGSRAGPGNLPRQSAGNQTISHRDAPTVSRSPDRVKLSHVCVVAGEQQVSDKLCLI